ncbi:MAG TPA: thioredoxin [Solirubrobacteraceae bacterium]|nr:thioredoxin [Solirubrobacteraceae bacterium]
MASLPAVTDHTFQAEVLESDVPVLVDFGADWCPPCRAIAPVLESIAAERDDLRIVTLDTDANPATAAAHGVQGLPTLILFRGGHEAARVVGAFPKGRLLAALEPALTRSSLSS